MDFRLSIITRTGERTENSQRIEMKMCKKDETEGRGGLGVVTVTLICILGFLSILVVNITKTSDQ